MPSRLTVLNPGSVKVTLYPPGGSSSMRYWPDPSVTTDLTFSISAGLDASTVTPGSTAPDASLTCPAIDAWAYAATGSRRNNGITISVLRTPDSLCNNSQLPNPNPQDAWELEVGCWNLIQFSLSNTWVL